MLVHYPTNLLLYAKNVFCLIVNKGICTNYKDAREGLASLVIEYVCIYVIRLSPTRSEISLKEPFQLLF